MSHETADTTSEPDAGTDGESSSSADTTDPTASRDVAESPADPPSRDELLAQQRALKTENERLRSAYAAAQRSRYRRTAIALCLVGVVSIGAGGLLPASRRVLFAIGATGVFAGVMTYYLSPNRFVAATIGDRLIEANVATLTAFVHTLGLSGTIVYVPTTETTVQTDVLAFLPQSGSYTVPADLTPGVVTDVNPDAQGIATVPVGGLLLDEFTRALTADRATEPDALGEQLSEALTDQFELASSVEIETAVTGDTDTDTVPAGRLTVVGRNPVFATATAFDHPIGSFVASGVATAVERPVELRVDQEPSDTDAYQATVSWEDES